MRKATCSFIAFTACLAACSSERPEFGQAVNQNEPDAADVIEEPDADRSSEADVGVGATDDTSADDDGSNTTATDSDEDGNTDTGSGTDTNGESTTASDDLNGTGSNGTGGNGTGANGDEGPDAGDATGNETDADVATGGGSNTDRSNVDRADGGASNGSQQHNGQSCEQASNCESGFCADGVCCDTSCDGVCAACAQAGSEGTCTATQSDEACGTLTCPADTECRTYEGAALDANCAALNSCVAEADCTAAPVAADTPCQDGAGTCDGEGECVVPDKKALGESCAAADDCGSGHCVESVNGERVCCDAACDGVCEGCGSDGRCDATPDDDAACEAIECESDTACTSYPEPLDANRCASFGQCVTAAAHCAPEHAEEGTSCGSALACDGSGSCDANCDDDNVYCDGACIDPTTSVAFCGASGSCSGAQAGQACEGDASCVNGACKRWRAATTVGDGEGLSPLIVVDDTSHVTIVAGKQAYHRAPASSEWNAVTPITTEDALSPALGVTPSGKVWLLWESDELVYVRSYTPAQGWQTSPVSLNYLTEGETTTTPLLGIGATEDVMASWETSDNGIEVNRYSDALGGWQGARVLNDPDDENVINMQLAVDQYGNGAALWRNTSGTLRVSEYDRIASSWDQPDNFTFGMPGWGIASAATGCRDIYFVLYHMEGDLWMASRLIVDIEGRQPAYPETTRVRSEVALRDPVGACGSDEGYFLAWEDERLSDGSSAAFVMRFEDDWSREDDRWQSEVHALNLGTGRPDPLAMATDRYGNAFVGWAERAGSALTVLVSRYDRATNSWSDSIPLATGTLDTRSTNFGVGVATDAAGNGYVTWRLNGNLYLAEYR